MTGKNDLHAVGVLPLFGACAESVLKAQGGE